MCYFTFSFHLYYDLQQKFTDFTINYDCFKRKAKKNNSAHKPVCRWMKSPVFLFYLTKSFNRNMKSLFAFHSYILTTNHYRNPVHFRIDRYSIFGSHFFSLFIHIHKYVFFFFTSIVFFKLFFFCSICFDMRN